ncbi:CCR4-NOT transcription complex [Neofusicoccum parvum]|uniref:Putative ccr4-not transcription complex protein n=1 Tax=Botryosphaeria parva (strain UCR-NP2) TaxID=1287680 RepID=R1EJV8_BOTPV|nr:putative ccr4-not transcription complex protein [Neofusicoccum parvum UCRNP2]GME32900.1 CCR4-NOT transcription complex [Neofusicoccum parvum]
MAARKLAQEIDRCFKKVAEGVAAFEGIYEKLQQSTNPAQKEKLEDALKKEIKKLQRSRDQIKAWAASNEIKDKKPLLDQRKLIETQMEKFKAVEKEMKTKAYSKEGLSAASKLDPKEKEKVEVCDFLSNMVEELERQVETTEAEAATLQAGLKKGKKDTAKAERIAELERQAERHQWHIGKLELVRRSLENDGIEVEQVKDLEESIRYYVENNQEVDFMEDDSLYEDLNLAEGEDLFGMAQEMDKVSSQDTQSIQDDSHEDIPRNTGPAASKAKADHSQWLQCKQHEASTTTHKSTWRASQSVDADKPRHYRPQNPYPYTPAHYPQEPLSIFDDPRLYSRVDTDSLFYAFYYRQGTYEQYLAAKALKSQSWRFHKQYQTWFQRHEEPKSITEDYEQGTYRFFDYESTWMNRRKADFKFAYKFLEDDL